MTLSGRILRKVGSWFSREADWMRFLLAVQGRTLADSAWLYLSALVSPLTSLRKLGWYRPPYLLANIDVVERNTGTFNLRKGTDDVLHIMWWREPGLFELIGRSLRPGDVFIDAGANIGFYSILASRLVGNTGQVLAFEMMPQTATNLRRNLEMSGASNVTVHECALSDTSGETLTASFNPTFLGQSSVSSTLGAVRTNSVEVKTSTFDGIVPPGRIRMMKIDLEGHELQALKGGECILRNVDLIVFENTTKDQQIDQFLLKNGFMIEHLEHDDFIARKTLNAQTH